MCEPIFELPQKINIQLLAQIEKSKQNFKKSEEISIKLKPKSTYELKSDFRVLPTFDHKDRLRSVLSLEENEFLRCKFSEYIEKKGSFVAFKIRPNHEINIFKQTPRPLSLTGKFYGTDYKLAPVPVMENPRQYTKYKKIFQGTNTDLIK